MKVKKKKVRIHFVRIIILALIVYVFYLGINFLAKLPIKNIFIEGNTYLTDQEILELAAIDNYPSFYWTSSNSIKRKLLTSPFISDVKIKKSFYNVVTINVTENRILFYNNVTKKTVFADKKEITLDQEILGIPRLINNIDSAHYDTLIAKLITIDNDILDKVSEINYMPVELDNDRFLLYMNDGNSVYLTLTKFNMLNYYNELLPQLEGKKGILYLDSGNHFEIIE